MNQKISKTEFRESLDRRLSVLEPDPWMAKRIIASGKGEKKVKKTSGFTIVIVFILILTMATALAAVVNGWKLGDFWSYQSKEGQSSLPDNYEELIEKKDITAESDYAVYSVSGCYFDGSHVSLDLDVAPKEEALLMHSIMLEDPECSVMDMYYNQQVKEDIPVVEYVRTKYGGKAAGIRCDIVEHDKNGATVNLSAGYGMALNEDGSASVLLLGEMKEKDLAERDIELEVHFIKADVSEDGTRFEKQEEDTVTIPLTVHPVKKEAYVCEEELVFSSVGTKLTKAVLTVTPLEIWCDLTIKVTDEELYKKQWKEIDPTDVQTIAMQWNLGEAVDSADGEVQIAAENGVTADPAEDSRWMYAVDNLDYEFVYPDGRTVPLGVGGNESATGDYVEPKNGAVRRVRFPISRDALSDHYAIRAYNWETGERFETVEFTVKPAEE